MGIFSLWYFWYQKKLQGRSNKLYFICLVSLSLLSLNPFLSLTLKLSDAFLLEFCCRELEIVKMFFLFLLNEKFKIHFLLWGEELGNVSHVSTISVQYLIPNGPNLAVLLQKQTATGWQLSASGSRSINIHTKIPTVWECQLKSDRYT